MSQTATSIQQADKIYRHAVNREYHLRNIALCFTKIESSKKMQFLHYVGVCFAISLTDMCTLYQPLLMHKGCLLYYKLLEQFCKTHPLLSYEKVCAVFQAIQNNWHIDILDNFNNEIFRIIW
jgi:hypothetical protein